MTVETFQGNYIAPGHDNTANLVNIETVCVDELYFPAIDDLGKYSEGVGQIRGDHVVQPQGGHSTSWQCSGALSLRQWEWIYFTVLGGNRSGKVTIRTQQFTPGFYVIANAVLTIGDPPALSKILRYYRPFTWVFTNLEILEEDLMYGIIYAKDASTAQTAIKTTPVLLTGFAADGVYSGTTPAHGSDNITVSYSRTYKIVFRAELGSLTASTIYKFNIRVAAAESVYQCQFTSNATPDVETVSMEGILALTADQAVTIYVETNNSDAGAALTMLNGSLSVMSLSTS